MPTISTMSERWANGAWRLSLNPKRPTLTLMMNPPMVPARKSIPARAGISLRTTATTRARAKPATAWRRNKVPIVGRCLYPPCHRSRWIPADQAIRPAPASMNALVATHHTPTCRDCSERVVRPGVVIPESSVINLHTERSAEFGSLRRLDSAARGEAGGRGHLGLHRS